MKLSPDNHLSGSVLPAYMGHSPYQTPYDCLERARAHNNGEPRPELDSLPADVGTAVEPVILARGCKLLGIDPGLIKNYQEDGEDAAKRHSDLELYYSDDGIINLEQPLKIYSDVGAGVYVMNADSEITLHGKVILEAKFTTVPKKPSDPPLYRGPIQLQAGMICHEAQFGILYTCYGGRTIEVNIFEKHDETVKQIYAAVNDFETHMENGTWPEPTTAEDYSWKYQEPDPEPEIDLGSSLEGPVLDFQNGVQDIKKGQEAKEKAALDIMAALGNHKVGIIQTNTGQSFKATWPWRTTKAKPPSLCPHCDGIIAEAKPETTKRQKTITIKEVKS